MAQSTSKSMLESRANTVKLLDGATLADSGAGGDVMALERNGFVYNTVYLKQLHATANASVIIEAAPCLGEELWVPVAALEEELSYAGVTAPRTDIVTLPPGAYNYLRARILSEDTGASVDLWVVSHNQFAT